MFRNLPPEAEAMKALFREIDDRLGDLEQGRATAGQASFAKRIRVGDFYLFGETVGGVVTVKAQNAVSGGPATVIATLS